MNGRTAIVLCGAVAPDVAIPPALFGDRAFVVAADGAAGHAAGLGLRLDYIVGDLDSIASTDLEAARAAGVAIEQHPCDKPETDLELALTRALGAKVASILVIDGGVGERVDHFVANLAVLASPRWASVTVRAVVAHALVTVIRPERGRVELCGPNGSTVSLVPLGGDAHGVTTSGLRWPLRDETLAAYAARGMSNEMVDVVASVTVREGSLLAFQPWDHR